MPIVLLRDNPTVHCRAPIRSIAWSQRVETSSQPGKCASSPSRSATRKGWEGKASPSDQIATLEAVAKQRTADAAGAAPTCLPTCRKWVTKAPPRDLQEAADYYLTPRGQHPNAPNKMLRISASYMVAFTGFDQVSTFLTQPVLVAAGSEAGSLWHSQKLYTKAHGPKELFIVEGATHMDLYDCRVDLVVAKLTPFFTRNLA
jgi:fermentation-respiration switch protein FrsA (DUF1100 family)